MKKTQQRSADARAVGAGAACLAVALLVCGFTYVLRAVDFGPLRALIMEEDHLYDVIRAPEVRPLKNAHRVVFIDIDDETVKTWNTPDGAPPSNAPLPNNTPRKLIAQLARFARDAHAKVIFLDFDFRNSLPDDADLHAELAQTDKPPILIPTFFTSGRPPRCEDQTDARSPTELETAFSDLTELSKDPPPGSGKGLPSIALVHPLSDARRLRAAGRRMFVLSRALRFPGRDGLAGGGDGARGPNGHRGFSPCEPADQCIKTLDFTNPELLPVRWTIGKDTDQKYAPPDNSGPKGNASERLLVYSRVKADFLVKYQGLRDPSAEQSAVLKDAIVVIGTTAQWSEDTLATPLGDLQGVLAHVNFALSLQSFNDEAPPFAAALFRHRLPRRRHCRYGPCSYWRPIFRSLGPRGQTFRATAVSRLFSEAGVFVICGVFFAPRLRCPVSFRLSLPCRLALWNSHLHCGVDRRADDRGLLGGCGHCEGIGGGLL